MNTQAAYRCKIFRPNSKAWLKLGTKRRFVEVIEQSRDSFTVRSTPSIAAKVKVGMKIRLLYQEMLWSVRCKDKWLNTDGGFDMEMEPLEELTPPKLVQGSIFQRSKQVSASNSMDGTIPLLLLCLAVIGILILPAWGGQWGTSQLICDGVNTIWKSLVSMATGRSY